MARQTIFQEPLIYSRIAEHLSSSELIKLSYTNEEMQLMLSNITEYNFLLNNRRVDQVFLNFLINLPSRVLRKLQTPPEIGSLRMISGAILFPNIHSLDFSNNNGLSNDMIINIFSRCPNLENIDISNVSIFGNDISVPINSILLYLTKNVPGLKKLNIWGCIVSGFYLENLIDKCNQLEELYITQSTINGRITNNFLDILEHNCSKLKKLCIEKCTNITSEKLCKYLEKNKQLTYLNIAGCYDLDDFVIFTIIKYKNLEKLVITDGMFSQPAMILLSSALHNNIIVEIAEDDDNDMEDAED